MLKVWAKFLHSWLECGSADAEAAGSIHGLSMLSKRYTFLLILFPMLGYFSFGG